MKTISSILLLSLFSTLYAGQWISGKVLDGSTDRPLVGVNISINDSLGTTTDGTGRYVINVPVTASVLHFSHIGYREKAVRITAITPIIRLLPTEILLPDISISSTRVIPGVTPVSYSTLTFGEISSRVTAEDAPMLLSAEPGIYAYSESGNGTGYSYLSIRGFDQSRIAVMVDNVPLNDNESHQVYWVDHGDILSNAQDVEIQRGVGNSLYGATAFGGSINVQTSILSDEAGWSLSALAGSYATQKYRLEYQSGRRFGENLGFTLRGSSIASEGYRRDSKSDQRSVFAGLEFNSAKMKNQLRLNIGKEISRLQWDGISGEMINNRNLRTGKMEWTVPFTDDFLQQLYSLNSLLILTDALVLKNTAYFVKGSGFYEVRKYGRDFYSYNLDILNEYPDSLEMSLETDLLRRKWIRNRYYGLVPTLTYRKGRWRNDLGIELRQYSGDHFGEISRVSDPVLAGKLPAVYRYYEFKGEKFSTTLFNHTVYSRGNLHLTADLQFQMHRWSLNQQAMGHFPGYRIRANWEFLNPRVGASYTVTPEISLFTNYGIARKEPADDQILNADDVWDTPKAARPEKISDLEIGFDHHTQRRSLKVNYYFINYKNEILTDIYDFEETQFEVKAAEETIHRGVEFETTLNLHENFTMTLNGAIASNYYAGGPLKNRQLMNTPQQLFNFSADFTPNEVSGLSLLVKYVGRQYIDDRNSRELSIDPFAIFNFRLWIKYQGFQLNYTVNNIFDKLYSTYGYRYNGGYYWPGATRNMYLELKYNF